MSTRKLFKDLAYLDQLDIYRPLRMALLSADRLLPNSNEEARFLAANFGVPLRGCTVVPNGVDPAIGDGSPDLFRSQHSLDDFVLFVGRIEPRKNVHRLITAFVRSELDTQLVILGQKPDLTYFSACQAASNARVFFLPPVAHDSPLLRSAYKSARVVALPSYFETPGLAALEGGSAGANLVVTPVGGAREYFREYAWYARPESERSIRDALVSAYEAPKSSLLSNLIRDKFSWERAAEATLQTYKSIA